MVDNDSYLKTLGLNLLAKIMFYYSENLVENILLILNKKETKIVEGSFEKFQHISDCREYIEILQLEEKLKK